MLGLKPTKKTETDNEETTSSVGIPSLHSVQPHLQRRKADIGISGPAPTSPNMNWTYILTQQAQNMLSNVLSSIVDVDVSVTPLGKSDLMYSMKVRRAKGAPPIIVQLRTDDLDYPTLTKNTPLHHVLLGKAITQLILVSIDSTTPEGPVPRPKDG